MERGKEDGVVDGDDGWGTVGLGVSGNGGVRWSVHGVKWVG